MKITIGQIRKIIKEELDEQNQFDEIILPKDFENLLRNFENKSNIHLSLLEEQIYFLEKKKEILSELQKFLTYSLDNKEILKEFLQELEYIMESLIKLEMAAPDMSDSKEKEAIQTATQLIDALKNILNIQ